MKLRLSPRLQRIADYVPAGSCIVDVGTDHAYLPIWLLLNGRSEKAYASDIRPGPLRNAAADAAAAGVRDALTLLECDGLRLCPPEAVDTVVIAGMGGETIMGILDAAPWALEKRLLLQPQTKLPELRAYLAARERRIADASLVCDCGRFYEIWSVTAGGMDPDRRIDPSLREKRELLLLPYAEDQIKRLRKQIQGLERAQITDPVRLAALRRALAEYREVEKEASTWQA